ncbi:MAG: hypothetical protein J6M53_06820 [Bacteroidaceae bacterium]|nr:hypothetical protein [Bacteroidaceae bacterium]
MPRGKFFHKPKKIFFKPKKKLFRPKKNFFGSNKNSEKPTGFYGSAARAARSRSGSRFLRLFFFRIALTPGGGYRRESGARPRVNNAPKTNPSGVAQKNSATRFLCNLSEVDLRADR